MIDNFNFEIKSALKRALVDMGFEKPTEIQAKAIPLILEGIDVIGKSQTGSGKTVAFGVPAVDAVDTSMKKNPQILIICPTRELAIQAGNEIKKLTKYTHGIKTAVVYGGQPISRQIPVLKQGVSIVIGTPGRILDHLKRKTIKLSDIKMVVLDEADEMLNMGFRDDIEDILNKTPDERQTILFSATMPKAIMEIVDNYQKNPTVVEVKSPAMTVDSIDQYFINCKKGRKADTLLSLLDEKEIGVSIIFCNTKRMVDELTETLQDMDVKARGLHGDMRQRERDRVMQDFRRGRAKVLIATDVAARGIDVSDVEAVINYDIPQQTEYYVHRIGRTGRAGRGGLSVTLLQGRRQKVALDDIMRHTKSDIKPLELETIETDNADLERKRGDRAPRDSRRRKESDRPSFRDRKRDDGDRKPREEKSSFKDRGDRDFKSKDRGDRDFKSKDRSDRDFKSKDRSDRDFKSKDRSDRDFKSKDRGDRDFKSKDRNSAKKSNLENQDVYTMRLSVGKNAGATPKNILGAVAGESGVHSKFIGSISIKDSYALVEIPKNQKDLIVSSVNGAKIAGKKVSAE